jgi:hypothetical protein
MRRVTRFTVIAAVAVGAALFVLELIARYGFGLGTPPLTRTDPLLEYQFVPNQDVQRFGNRIAINRYGMRSPDFPPQRRRAERRVLIFGDSVLFGGSTLDQRLIATSLLSHRLGPNTTLGNVSAGSWGPGNYLGWAKRYGFLGATDVILLDSSHDLYDLPFTTPFDTSSHPTHNPPLASWELLTRYLIPRLGIANVTSIGADNPNVIQSRDAERRGLADLKNFILLAQKSGARVSVVQFWELREIKSGVMQPGHQQQLRLFQSLNFPSIQAGPLMKECALRSGKTTALLFFDNIHPFTSLGQKCLADVLERALLP